VTNTVDAAWRTSSFSGSGACVELNWRRSSFSSGGSNCVESARPTDRDVAYVRDTKRRDAGTLTLPSHGFSALVEFAAAYPA
jgi:Domain of unknown function (DUF397)